MTGVGGSFDPHVHRAAQLLLDSGRIANVRVLQNGRIVTGIANPDPALPGAPHRVYIRYRQPNSTPDALALEAECSFGEISPCPHVAAVAMMAAGAAQVRPAERRRGDIDAVPRSAQQALCYRLEDIDGICRVSVWVAQIAAGTREIPDDAREFTWRTAESSDDYPRYVAAADRPTLEALRREPEGSLQGEIGSQLLERIATTGRAVWRAPHRRTLRWGESRELSLEWRAAANGEQQLHIAGTTALDLIVSVEPAMYVDAGAGECGPLRLAFGIDLLRRYWGRPALAPEHVAEVIEALAARPHAAEFPRPRALRVLHEPLSTLCGSLTLSAGPDAIVHFLYNGHPIVCSELRDAHTTVRHLVGGTAAGIAVPALFAADHVFIALEDGRHLPVPTIRLQRIAETLVELFDRDALNGGRALTLPRSQAGRLAVLAQDVDAPALRSDDPSLSTLIADLANFSAIAPLQAPPQCRATLREYQERGLGWLQFLRRHRLGGILADDMGLGKTIQTLAHLATEKADGRLARPALIVAPVSVLGNWQREVRRFTPDLTAVTVHGARRRRSFASLDAVDVIIIGYASLLFDAEVLLDREYSVVILDEAQTIKNPHANVSQAARALRAQQRLCLTGTPMENHLGDLWSLFDFVQPGLLGTERDFQRQYRTPIENGGNALRAAALKERIAPFLLRRTKDAVAPELPRKTEIIESIVMEEPQRDLYDGIRLSMHRRVREAIAEQGLARSRVTLLDALLKLRQVCCDPRLLGSAVPGATTPNAAVSSGKLDWLATALPV